jgi:hypothetical protein
MMSRHFSPFASKHATTLLLWSCNLNDVPVYEQLKLQFYLKACQKVEKRRRFVSALKNCIDVV